MYVPDPQQAVALTEKAIEDSGLGADQEWLEIAESITLWVAERVSPFSSNDVWGWLETPANRRSLGFAFRRLQSKGKIHRTGKKVPSRWGHGQEVSLWTLT